MTYLKRFFVGIRTFLILAFKILQKYKKRDTIDWNYTFQLKTRMVGYSTLSFC